MIKSMFGNGFYCFKHVSINFKKEDLWIGMRWKILKTKTKNCINLNISICIIPMIPIEIEFIYILFIDKLR